jgi:ribose-phosphate pyrophosphokinase
MIYSNPHQIGVLACPGGAVFAEKLINELEYLSQKRTRHKVDILSEKYGMSREQIIRQINLSVDMRPTTLNLSHPQDRIRATHYRVPAHFTRFANGEFKTEITSTVRNSDLYIIQDVENQYPLFLNDGEEEKYTLTINDHIFCLLVTVDAALQAGARAVTVVLPTYPYARQHKKKGREGLTAARIGQILENLGVARVITLDLHSKEIENSFNRLRVENLHASYQILKVLNQIVDLKDPDLVIISPDTGSVDRNKFYSTALNKALGMIYKERDYSRASLSATQNNITHIHLLGEVKGKTIFMADDMLGTGGTILKAMKTLNDLGAKRIICSVSLPIFSGSAIENFEQAFRQGLFYRMIGTNAIYHDKTLTDREWYVFTDISQLFARAICRLHNHRSVGSLMDNRRIIKQLLDKAMQE